MIKKKLRECLIKTFPKERIKNNIDDLKVGSFKKMGLFSPFKSFITC